MRIQLEKQANRMQRQPIDGPRRRSMSGRTQCVSVERHSRDVHNHPLSPIGDEMTNSSNSSNGCNSQSGAFNYASVIVANTQGDMVDNDIKPTTAMLSSMMMSQKAKCRTGWPQQVWAHELKNCDQ